MAALFFFSRKLLSSLFVIFTTNQSIRATASKPRHVSGNCHTNKLYRENPMRIILKIMFWPINILFVFIIYILSLRPLSPSEEQLIRNYSGKPFIGFIFECLCIQSIFALIFSSIVYLIFKSIIREYLTKHSYILTVLVYLVISIFCGLEYFLWVNKIVYK